MATSTTNTTRSIGRRPAMSRKEDPIVPLQRETHHANERHRPARKSARRFGMDGGGVISRPRWKTQYSAKMAPAAPPAAARTPAAPPRKRKGGETGRTRPAHAPATAWSATATATGKIAEVLPMPFPVIPRDSTRGAVRLFIQVRIDAASTALLPRDLRGMCGTRARLSVPTGGRYAITAAQDTRRAEATSNNASPAVGAAPPPTPPPDAYRGE
mmetsp:Transcript_3523/g.7279  ORF Transcript_3523/g.7279 Transcript_3523/m.7279 type:complete len:214 (-) Transcript_3523:9-650(-)